MITAEQVLAFGLAAFVLIAIPGPSVVFVVGRALAYGRSVALATVLGNTLGLLTIVFLIAVGLGAILEESIVIFTILKFAGAAYLAWLGIQAIRHRRAFSVENPGAEGVRPLRLPRVIRQGYIVGVSNPKAFMIFGAVLPQFVVRGNGHVQFQMLLLGLVAVTIGLVSDSLWAVVASQLRRWFSASPRRGEAMGVVGGSSMIGLGVYLAATDNR